jgi:hypothetical protein
MWTNEMAIENYQDGQIMFKPLENYNCINVYDNDLSGNYYVDINLQAVVLAGKYRKLESESGFFGGCNLWYSAIEKNIISFKCDTFEILKDKDENEIKEIVFKKWKSILHNSIKGDNSKIKLTQSGIVIQKQITLELLNELEKSNIYKMPFYFAERLNAPYIKKGQIEIRKIKQDLDWYNNKILK